MIMFLSLTVMLRHKKDYTVFKVTRHLREQVYSFDEVKDLCMGKALQCVSFTVGYKGISR